MISIKVCLIHIELSQDDDFNIKIESERGAFTPSTRDILVTCWLMASGLRKYERYQIFYCRPRHVSQIAREAENNGSS